MEVGTMTAQTHVAAEASSAPGTPAQAAPERTARYLPGIPMLVLGIVLLIAAVVCFWLASKHPGGGALALGWAGALLILAGILVLRGLTPVAPGRAHVIQLFGKYRGTIREPGLQWVNPFTHRIPISTRIRNLESAQAKVNDADGNPIEIAAVVVWQVADTAHATYAVDDYARFVAIQAETAVRHIASHYPYDSRGTDALSLRDNADEVTERLATELAERVKSAGVRVIETRLTRLSYAAEIAQAMLRQQQASAVVAARSRIVEGAVGMVKLALQRLDDEGVVELDEERKAAMVSNLLVVLCSEQATQQVVNTGSLYS
jgi:regulator of protease activity HflC (stomatin/prohibitin superfamily)